MPDETGTETNRPDGTGVDDSLFGDAADETPAAPAGEQDSKEETGREAQGPEDAKSADAEGEAAETQEDSTEAGGQAGESEDASQEGLKVVVSIKGARATIGVQQPSSDPHIEVFDDLDEDGLTQEVAAVIERARARWEESPKHPAYERPAPPAKRRNNRRQQGGGAGRSHGDAGGRDAAADAEAVLGSLSAKHGGGRRNHCDGLPRPSICEPVSEGEVAPSLGQGEFAKPTGL